MLGPVARTMELRAAAVYAGSVVILPAALGELLNLLRV
jgi:hypothetical protein